MKAYLTPGVVEALVTAAASLIAIATPLIAVYVAIAARKLSAAAGVTLTEKQQVQLERAALLAGQGVEEYVRNAAKHGLTLTSNEKLDQAARIAREMATDGLKAWTDAQVKTAVESQLPQVRAKLSAAPPPMSPPTFPSALPELADELEADEFTRVHVPRSR